MLPCRLRILVVSIERGTSIFDIAFHLHEHAGGVSGGMEYSTALFDPETTARMVRHFCILLNSAAAGPDQPIDTIAMLDRDERRRFLARVRGQSGSPSTRRRSASNSNASQRPHLTVSHLPAPRHHHIWGADQQAEKLAAGLEVAGARLGEPVLLLLDRSPGGRGRDTRRAEDRRGVRISSRYRSPNRALALYRRGYQGAPRPHRARGVGRVEDALSLLDCRPLFVSAMAHDDTTAPRATDRASR